MSVKMGILGTVCYKLQQRYAGKIPQVGKLDAAVGTLEIIMEPPVSCRL